MSLALFNAAPVETIEILFDCHNQPWFKRANVGKYLELSDIHKSLSGLDKCKTRVRKTFRLTYHTTVGWSRPKDHQNKTDIFLSKRSVLYVINKFRKPSHNLRSLAEFVEVELYKNKWLSKEQESILNIVTAFEGKKMHIQYNVNQYRIDLYFPKHKLAIECDKFDHQDRYIEYEVKHQKCIEDKLGCTFIRCNPDAKDSNLFKVINQILNAMC